MRWIAIACFTTCFAASCASDPTPAPAPAQPIAEPIESSEPLAGGFAPANETDEWTQAAQSLAIDAVYDKYPTRALVGRVQSEVQVVAGLNYRFLIEMSGMTDYRSNAGFKDAFEVVVYRDLEGNMEVTSVERAQMP